MNLSRKEGSSLTQVMSCKAAMVQTLVQMVQRMAQKSCRTACRLFCCPFDGLAHEKITCCHGHTRESPQDKVTQVPPWNPPSTIYIVNISNSTLTDCVIGKAPYPSTVAEQQPLMQEEPTRCSCMHGQQGAAQAPPPQPPPPPPPPPLLLPSAESQNISIHSSSLSCVIIGDNNYMQVENTELLE